MVFGSPREARQEVVDLGLVTDEVLRLLRSTLSAGIQLRTEFASAPPHVVADAGQVHEVIVNLTTNAAYAIGGESGTITYRLEPVQIGERETGAPAGLKPGSYVRLTVIDTGCGIDPARLERIFDAFYTTKPVGEGAGLGLSMVHGIMKSHGGAVTAESDVGRGARFSVYFRAADRAAAAAAPLRAEIRSETAGRRVLFVDDEEALVLVAQRMLGRLGHTVNAFTDPNAALAHFRNHPDDFDVMVTDLSMPGLSGFELSRAVLALRPRLPIVLTTGWVRGQDETTARDVGIRELVLKPLSMGELNQVIDQLFT
jgi:CheY-like chemotaxis protein